VGHDGLIISAQVVTWLSPDTKCGKTGIIVGISSPIEASFLQCVTASEISGFEEGPCESCVGVPVILESKFHEPAPCHSSVRAGHGYDACLMEIERDGWCQSDVAIQYKGGIKMHMRFYCYDRVYVHRGTVIQLKQEVSEIYRFRHCSVY
jgi:hypothetical protein